MNLDLDLQLASANTDNLPSLKDFSEWISPALPHNGTIYELTVRIVDEEESQTLNHQVGLLNCWRILQYHQGILQRQFAQRECRMN